MIWFQVNIVLKVDFSCNINSSSFKAASTLIFLWFFLWISVSLSNTLTGKSLFCVISKGLFQTLAFTPAFAVYWNLQLHFRCLSRPKVAQHIFFLNCKEKRIMASKCYILETLWASKEYLHVYCHSSASTSHNTSPFRLRNSIIWISQAILGVCHISPHEKSDKTRCHSWAF